MAFDSSMTPAQRMLEEAISMRVQEINIELGVACIAVDWVILIGGQDMRAPQRTFYHREVRGNGDVSTYAELGLIEHARTRLKNQIGNM